MTILMTTINEYADTILHIGILFYVVSLCDCIVSNEENNNINISSP